jgi:hypothetical protein
VRKLSDAATGVVAELSTTIAANSGSFLLAAPVGAGDNFGWNSRGTVIPVTTIASGYAAPFAAVLSGIGDIAGDNATLRVNGAQVGQTTTDQGTGNYLSYPAYIGARAGTSNFLNGQLFSLIARFGPNLDANTIERTERYVALKVGFGSPTITGEPTIGVS